MHVYSAESFCKLVTMNTSGVWSLFPCCLLLTLCLVYVPYDLSLVLPFCTYHISLLQTYYSSAMNVPFSSHKRTISAVANVPYSSHACSCEHYGSSTHLLQSFKYPNMCCYNTSMEQRPVSPCRFWIYCMGTFTV